MTNNFNQLYGRVFITGNIVATTGLHIGGTGGSFTIGGVDNPVISNPITGEPYIPGSTLKGKIRSLTEKYIGRVTGQRISQIEIHSCHVRGREDAVNQAEYEQCPICNIFGITAEGYNWPTRLIVRDVHLAKESAAQLDRAKTALPYTELKTEVSIDRVTSQATPRDIERIPAGAVFGPMELVYSIYAAKDVAWLSVLIDGLELLQDDYLGGSGSRGSGKVEFRNLTVTLKRAGDYRNPHKMGTVATLDELSAGLGDIQNAIQQYMFNGA